MFPKSTLTTLALLALAGCSMPGEKDFLCGAETGRPCATLSEVDGSSSPRGLPVAERTEDTRNATFSQEPLGIGKSQGRPVVAGLNDGGSPYVSTRYRIPEKTGTLWIAPRRDEAEILHEATFVHFVISNARWGNR